MIDLFALLLLTSPFLVLGWLIFAVVVGCVATAKNRNFFGWFLLSFPITPLFAMLALIAVPARAPQPERPVGWSRIVIVAILLVAGIIWLMPRHPSSARIGTETTSGPIPAALAITITPEPVSIPLPRPRPAITK